MLLVTGHRKGAAADEALWRPQAQRQRVRGTRDTSLLLKVPFEITAAFLWAQLEQAERITAERLAIWNRYHDALAPLEQRGVLRRPIVPPDCQHNGHIYYILLESAVDRPQMLAQLRENGIYAVFHYVPLHSSPAGMRFGRATGELAVTTSQSGRLVRLPMWLGLQESQQQRVGEVLRRILLD